MVESTGLENRHTLIAYLGFKSLSLRHIRKTCSLSRFFSFNDSRPSNSYCKQARCHVRILRFPLSCPIRYKQTNSLSNLQVSINTKLCYRSAQQSTDIIISTQLDTSHLKLKSHPISTSYKPLYTRTLIHSPSYTYTFPPTFLYSCTLSYSDTLIHFASCTHKHSLINPVSPSVHSTPPSRYLSPIL